MWMKFLDMIGWNKPTLPAPRPKGEVVTKAEIRPTVKKDEPETCQCCSSTDIHMNYMCYDCYIRWVIIISCG